MSTQGPHEPTRVRHAALPTPLGEAHLFGTAAGLLAVALPDESPEAATARLGRRIGPLMIVDDAACLSVALAQLAAYFAGDLRAFDLPLDLRGTPFQRAVWRAASGIPYGETRHYREIAAALSSPAAARAVGAANAANPVPPIIPCHRLIGADGALRGHRSGLATKRWLLAHERAGDDHRRDAEAQRERGKIKTEHGDTETWRTAGRGTGENDGLPPYRSASAVCDGTLR